MTQDGGQRVATADGAMLADRASLGNVAGLVLGESLFDAAFWAARGQLIDVERGRGSAWFVSAAPEQWVLRHNRRGGCIARLSADRYVWTGEARVRAFAEWRLLAKLARLGLPVPAPIAARYQKTGPLYCCDLITRRIPGGRPLSMRLEGEMLREATWHDLGSTVARFHAAGVDHADLNAHNLLIDDAGIISLIDFDRGRLRPPAAGTPGPWAARNLARLQRSLIKLARTLPSARFGERQWQWLLDGYASAARL